MKKKYSSIVIFAALFFCGQGVAAQSLVAIGNTKFPINDNISTAPAAAINGGWQINGIGKIVTIVADPSVATTMYACSASGGIFKTTNSGASWSALNGSFVPGVQFGSLAIDPGNTNVMYAGTGEPDYAQTYGWSGYGVFKSIDGGATWAIANTGMGNLVVSDLLINPGNTQMIIAGTQNGLYISTNGGTNWTVALSAPGQWIHQVLRQGTGSNLLAIGNTRFYRSTNFGATWTTTDLDPSFSGTFANGRIAVAPSNNNIVYAGWVNNTFSSCYNACMYYSSDGGVTFIKKHAFADAPFLLSYDGSSTTGYGWANFFITVSLTDPNTIWTGGHLIFKSADNGGSWTTVLSQWWCCIHTDIHQLMYDPNNSNRFLAANDGGIFASNDLGVSWAPLSNGLACNQYESMAQGNIDSNFVIGGLQDNGIIYKNTDGNYHTYAGGDFSAHMTCDYTNAYNVYTSNGTGSVFNPYNRSQSATLNLPASVASGQRQSFFLSAITPSIAYGWGTNVFRSTNINNFSLSAGTSGVSWTQISSFNVTLQDVKTSPVDDNVLYALGNNAVVYKSTNAAGSSPTFAAISLPAGAATSVYGSLTVSTLNPNVIYVSANSAVYRSANAGATWSNYTASGLPSINFQKIFIDPFSTIESVYLVTSLGIYYRDLTMPNWTTVNPQVNPALQNSAASYVAGLISGTSLYKGTGSATSHVSFATWGSGIWKANFYNQQSGGLPSGWSNFDIGSPSVAGSAGYDYTKNTFNLNGAGSGINNASTDQFNFTATNLTGNSDMVVKVISVAETVPSTGLSKTGLMIRNDNSVNSPYAMITLTGHAGAVFQYRANTGDVATVTTASPAPAINYPYYLKLNKNINNSITASISPDSTNWTQVGQATISLANNFLGGVATTSNTASVPNKSSTGVIALSNFVVLSIDNVLLSAVLLDQSKVALTWSFESDETINYTILEKSTDGTNFTPMLQRTYPRSAGTLQTISDATTDENPFSGNNYYRLKITSRNGDIKYSNIASIYLNRPLSVKIEPNPVLQGGSLKVILAGRVPNSQIYIDLFDITGRRVSSQLLSTNSNNTIAVGNLSAGTYLYRIFYEKGIYSGKVIIEKR